MKLSEMTETNLIIRAEWNDVTRARLRKALQGLQVGLTNDRDILAAQREQWEDERESSEATEPQEMVEVPDGAAYMDCDDEGNRIEVQPTRWVPVDRQHDEPSEPPPRLPGQECDVVVIALGWSEPDNYLALALRNYVGNVYQLSEPRRDKGWPGRVVWMVEDPIRTFEKGHPAWANKHALYWDMHFKRVSI